MNKNWKVEVLDRLDEYFPAQKTEENKAPHKQQISIGSDTYALEFLSPTKNAVLASQIFQEEKNRAEHQLLCFPQTSNKFQDWLRQNNQQFIDGAGNAWIQTDTINIWVEGRKSDVLKNQPTQRAFKATGLRVIFVLLAYPELTQATLRTISDYAGVSLGAVSNTLKDLEALGYLLRSSKQLKIKNKKELTDRWIEHYQTTLFPVLQKRQMTGASSVELRSWVENNEEYVLSGESALESLGQGIAAETSTIYGEYPWKQITVDLRLRPETQGDILLVEKFWKTLDAENATAPPLLIYADALASNDSRQIEIAMKFRERNGEF